MLPWRSKLLCRRSTDHFETPTSFAIASWPHSCTRYQHIAALLWVALGPQLSIGSSGALGWISTRPGITNSGSLRSFRDTLI
ncbi:hypothetical protein BDV12DRAFT_165086 [Aspergillus spectabilis]